LREINLTCDVDGGRGDDAHSESSSSIPAPGKRTPYQFLNSLKVKGAKLQEKLKRVFNIIFYETEIFCNFRLTTNKTQSNQSIHRCLWG
jgi:hypothetical protein